MYLVVTHLNSLHIYNVYLKLYIILSIIYYMSITEILPKIRRLLLYKTLCSLQTLEFIIYHVA